MQTSPSATQGHHPPHHGGCDNPIYAAPPPEEPPPSYDDATRSATSPILVGPPPDYGTFRAYVDPDESSETSSEVEETDQTLSERIGQVFSVMCLAGILYVFWKIINQPDPNDFRHPYVSTQAARP